MRAPASEERPGSTVPAERPRAGGQQTIQQKIINDMSRPANDREQARRLRASQLNWISGDAPEAGSKLTAKVRYRQADQDCRVEQVSSDTIELEFHHDQRAVTPGQSVVLYDGDECLGGGIIDWMNTIPGAGEDELNRIAS